MTSDGLAARRAALSAITDVEVRGAWSNLAVPAAVDPLDTEQDRSFASHLAYDTLRWQGTLDWALSAVLKRPLTEVEPNLRRVLRLGALQILKTQIPHHAVVDTGVKLAREQVPSRRSQAASGFVNGVLRNLVRRQSELPWPDSSDDAARYLALASGHPRWIVAELIARFGPERAGTILDADNRAPGLTLRATGDRSELVDELQQLGFDVRPGATSWTVRVPGGHPPRIAAVRQGRAVPQDEASVRVVEAANPKSGQRVLDLCAGPGGKASFLASLVEPDGEVIAVELHAHRARLIQEAAQRIDVEVKVVVADALDVRHDLGSFDVVVLDAPCSGLGTGRRRPEVRWRRTPEDVDQLALLQRRLLAAAVERVHEGGRLIYSVCTWSEAETERIADWFDERYGGGFTACERRQLWPDTDDTDGMFIAVWERDRIGSLTTPGTQRDRR